MIKAYIILMSICTNLWAYYISLKKNQQKNHTPLPGYPLSDEDFFNMNILQHTVLLESAIR